MEREPSSWDRRESAEEADGDAEWAKLSAWLETLPPPPGQPLTDEEIEASDARARADIAAGRVVPHEKVAAWLATWGTPDEKPMPPEWLE